MALSSSGSTAASGTTGTTSTTSKTTQSASGSKSASASELLRTALQNAATAAQKLDQSNPTVVRIVAKIDGALGYLRLL